MYVFMFIYCLKAPTTVVGLWFGSDLFDSYCVCCGSNLRAKPLISYTSAS